MSICVYFRFICVEGKFCKTACTNACVCLVEGRVSAAASVSSCSYFAEAFSSLVLDVFAFFPLSG